MRENNSCWLGSTIMMKLKRENLKSIMIDYLLNKVSIAVRSKAMLSIIVLRMMKMRRETWSIHMSTIAQKIH